MPKKWPMRLNYAIIFVSDMQRSISFYRDVLGLQLKFESPDWTEFATEGATVALHLSKDALSTNAYLEAPGSCRPGFGVQDLAAFHERVTELGVTCAQEPRNVFGTLIALYRDPDGLPISVAEHRDQNTSV
jgi:lactoylglutathione lyase